MPTASASHFLGWIGSKLEELDRRSLKRELRGRLAKRIYPQSIFQEMLYALGSQDGLPGHPTSCSTWVPSPRSWPSSRRSISG